MMKKNKSITQNIKEPDGWIDHWPLLLSLIILLIMLTLDYSFKLRPDFALELAIYTSAYLLAGYNVLNLAFRKAIRFDIFNELFVVGVEA